MILYNSATLRSNDTRVRAELLILVKLPSDTGMTKDIRTKCVRCNDSLISMVGSILLFMILEPATDIIESTCEMAGILLPLRYRR